MTSRALYVQGAVEPSSVRDRVYVAAEDGPLGSHRAVAQTLPASSVSISVMPSISSSLPLNHSRAFSTPPSTRRGRAPSGPPVSSASSLSSSTARPCLFGLHQPTFSGVAAPTSARASSMMSAASSAASRVTMSGGEMRMVFALRPPPLPTSRGRGGRPRGSGLPPPGLARDPLRQLQGQHQAPPADLGDDLVVLGHLWRRSEVGADLVGVGLQVVIQM